jgi:hypothetical protein
MIKITEMKVFKITYSKILSYLLTPLMGLILMLACFFYIIPLLQLPQVIQNVFYIIPSLIWIMPPAILLINHYLYLKETIFEYDDQTEEFYFSNKDVQIKFNKNDIIAIHQSSADSNRISWNHICTWDIELPQGVIKLSNLLVRKPEFYQLFRQKQINHEYRMLVLLK